MIKLYTLVSPSDIGPLCAALQQAMELSNGG